MTFDQMTAVLEQMFPDMLVTFDEDSQIIIETRATLTADDRVVNMADE